MSAAVIIRKIAWNVGDNQRIITLHSVFSFIHSILYAHYLRNIFDQTCNRNCMSDFPICPQCNCKHADVAQVFCSHSQYLSRTERIRTIVSKVAAADRLKIRKVLRRREASGRHTELPQQMLVFIHSTTVTVPARIQPNLWATKQCAEKYSMRKPELVCVPILNHLYAIGITHRSSRWAVFISRALQYYN